MKAVAFYLAFFALAFVSLKFVESVGQRAGFKTVERTVGKGVSIKVFGKEGEEWNIKGDILVTFRGRVRLEKVVASSASGYTIVADRIEYIRDRNEGIFEGNVQIRGEAFFVKTQRAEMNFNENVARGEGTVEIWKERNYARGRNFVAFLKPLRVIIEDVRTKHEL